MTSTNFAGASRSNTSIAVTQATGLTITGWANYDTLASLSAILQVDCSAVGVALKTTVGSPPTIGVWIEADGWAYTSSGHTIAADEWFFFMLTIDASGNVDLKIALDPWTAWDYEVTGLNNVSTWTTTQIIIGSNEDSEHFDGQLEDVRVFSDILTADEGLAEGASTTVVSTASCVAAWELEEGVLLDQFASNDLTGVGGALTPGAESAPIPSDSATYSADPTMITLWSASDVPIATGWTSI